MLVIEVLVLTCLIFIGYQDLKYRAVYWICFPLLSALLLWMKASKIGLLLSIQEAVFGMLFFGAQLLLLWIYFSIKNKKRVMLTSGYLGWGDVLFLLAISFYFSPFNYILFYVFSLLIVLIYTVITSLINKRGKQLEIPLAGLQALILCMILILSIFYPNVILYDDTWVDRF